MISSAAMVGAQPVLALRGTSQCRHQSRGPSPLPARQRRCGVLCAAAGRGRGSGGAGRGIAGRGAPPPPGRPGQDSAKEARSDAAKSAKDAISDVGDQLADAVGSGVDNAEGAVADTQSQAARTAGRAERQADDVVVQSSTPAARSNAADASANAADARRQAASAAADMRSSQKADAAETENVVREQASQVAGAVEDGIESVPTPAEAVQGAGDTAADAVRGLGQAAGQASNAAEDVQKNAEGFAADLQRNAQQAAGEVSRGVDQAAEEASRIAKNAVSGGTQYQRGRSMLSNSTPLTSMTPAPPNGTTGEAAVPYHKARLLAHVAGLDRGFAANARQAELVESAVQALVSAAGPVQLTSPPSAPTPGPGAVASPVSITNAGVTSMAPEISSISRESGASTPGFAPPSGALPLPPGGALPPPGAGMAEGSAPPSALGGSGGSSGGGGPPSAAGPPKRSGMKQLAGLWRLVYSSGFAGKRSTGGRRPGVPISLLPAQFGQVYQGISPGTAGLDNIVELRRDALPSLPFLPSNQPAEALLVLKHRLEVAGPQTLQITFTGTDVNLQGGVAGLLNNLPEFSLPELPEPLQPAKRNRSATFDVLFLDDDLRVTRGDRGEIRVFVRT